MCGSIYKDREASAQLTGPMTCRVLKDAKTGDPALGDEITASITDSVNARLESLEKIWIPKGALFVQTDTKIGSFKEQNRVVVMPNDIDLWCIAIPSVQTEWGMGELRFLTIPDGVTYKEQRGQYPPYVNEEIAVAQKKIHSRWPMYRRRIC